MPTVMPISQSLMTVCELRQLRQPPPRLGEGINLQQDQALKRQESIRMAVQLLLRMKIILENFGSGSPKTDVAINLKSLRPLRLSLPLLFNRTDSLRYLDQRWC